MSNHAAHAVWAERRAGRLPGGAALFVALAMADRANADGEVYAGVRTLAADTGLGRSTVGRAVRTLAAVGLYAEVVTAGGRRATTYRLAVSTRDANPVDNNGVASHYKATIASHPNAVASHLDRRSVPFGDAYKDEPNTEPEICARVEVPTRVSELRARLNGSEP